MEIPTLIYCADGNRRFAEIAIEHGYRYGAQLPNTVYFSPWFSDQNWRNPQRIAYMEALAKHKPYMATVLDWESFDQLDDVLGWAEEAAQFIEKVIVIPKVIGGISRLPKSIGGKDVILGYSVPTRYSGTSVPAWEFADWPVHLLGGSPQKQMELFHYMNVISADGNYAGKMATLHCQFWVPGNAHYAKNRWWPTLREANNGIRMEGIDLTYQAFEVSCQNIMEAWQNIR